MFIKSGEANIAVFPNGSPKAPAILGVGGWIGSSELWTQPFSTLSASWYTVSYDHRGTGVTLCPVAAISAETMINDVFTIMDALGIEKCVLAAESAGALTAFSAALRHPKRITGLVIVDGLYFDPTPPEKSLFLAGLRHKYAQTIDWFIQACLPEENMEHIKAWGHKILARATQDSAIALNLAVSVVDLRADLSRITQPTLIIHGDKDAIVPLESSQLLAKTLPNSKLIVFEGAGHVPTMTMPEKVANEIKEFFGMR